MVARRRRCWRKRNAPHQASAVPSSRKSFGSGTVLAGLMVVSDEELVTVVVPSRFTSTVKANPFMVSLVSTGIVPAGSENMLKANVLPEVEVPSGELNAGPYRLTSKTRLVPYVNPSK